VTSLLVVVALIRHVDGCIAMYKKVVELLEGCNGEAVER